jgi:hypothetical protein
MVFFEEEKKGFKKLGFFCLQLTKRYVNNISFQNFLSVKDMNAKKTPTF